MWTDRLLPDRLLELVRLRIAFFNQCRTCMAIRYPGAVADGLTEELVCSLEKPYEAPDLTAAERAAIRYGELLATDHLAIDESVYDDLRQHFTEEEIVELGTYCAFCVGFGRLGATWNMIEELPERFHEARSPPLGAARRSPFADASRSDEAKSRSVFSEQIELLDALVGAPAAPYVTDRHGTGSRSDLSCSRLR